MILFLLATGFVYWITKWKFIKIVMCVLLIIWLAEIAFCIGTLIGVAPTLMNKSLDLFDLSHQLMSELPVTL